MENYTTINKTYTGDCVTLTRVTQSITEDLLCGWSGWLDEAFDTEAEVLARYLDWYSIEYIKLEGEIYATDDCTPNDLQSWIDEFGIDTVWEEVHNASHEFFRIGAECKWDPRCEKYRMKHTDGLSMLIHAEGKLFPTTEEEIPIHTSGNGVGVRVRDILGYYLVEGSENVYVVHAKEGSMIDEG